MITINLSPVRSDDELNANWEAPILTVNDTEFDLSELPDGAEADHPVLGHVTRSGDNYSVVLRLPHGPQNETNINGVVQYAGEDLRFPDPITMNANGSIPIPTMTIVEVQDDLAE